MTIKRKFSHKLISIFLCVALFISCIPMIASAATPTSLTEKLTDAPTVNEWQKVFVSDSTENAGGVWADKSVFASGADYINATSEAENYDIAMQDEANNFLVSLSTIASNKQITGYSTTPTDTVLVLDMSSSMRSSTHNSIRPLATAANNAIKELLLLNENNRVGVVLYSGADENGTLQTRILMPIDRYSSTTDIDNDGEYDFMEYKTVNRQEGLGVVRGVTNSSGQTNFGLSGNQSTWSSGTFTQDGIYVAAEMILATDKIIPEGNIQAGQERMPIMVLMSDGEPSLISTDYAEGSTHRDGLNHLTSRFSNAYVTDTAAQFMVQLTAAYQKYRIEQAYNEHDLLFYSLGLRSNSNFPTTILDPESHVSTDSYWTRYLDDTRYQNWTLSASGRNWSITTSDTIRDELVAAVTSTAEADTRASGKNKYRYYIDKYFNASDNAALEGAFDEIVNEIILQSKYYPTLVSEGTDINYGGYLSMVDTLGKYMEVKDIKNIQLGGEAFYGRNAARELSSMTSLQGLTEIQSALLESVVSRLGVDKNTALDIITASQSYGNLYYSNTDFNNAICWYGNYTNAKNGAAFVSVWDGNGGQSVPAEANCKIQSYIFYGQGNNTVQVKDMRYIEVDVVTFLATGETKVRVRIPASLIPLITYEVRLNGETLDSPADRLVISGDDSPIRLIYEVGLRSDINSLNIGELAADAKNADGTYDFYTNKWDYVDNQGDPIEIGVTPPQTVGNAYAYFEPSAENEYMYYQQNTPIYQLSGNEYVLYTGTAAPDGEGFYGQRYYYNEPAAGSTSQPQSTYHTIEPLHLEDAVRVTEGGSSYWTIPKGSHVFANGERLMFYKDNDAPETANGGDTGTYKTSSTYYIAHTNSSGDIEYNMQVALGNNGKMTVAALQGIRLQKVVPANSGLDSATEYKFTVTPKAATLTAQQYDIYIVEGIDNDGTAGATANGSVQPVGGSLTVTLKANQTLYIAGLPEGEYTVTEAVGTKYIVSAIGDTVTNSNSTTVTVLSDRSATASFTNIARGTGNLAVSKEIEHPFGSEYTLPSKHFNIAVKLEFDGDVLSNQSFNDGAVITNAEGMVVVGGNAYLTLSHGEEFEIYGLPDGTTATVTEILSATEHKGFDDSYFDNGLAGDGVVDIVSGRTSSVIVVNTYAPDSTQPNIISLTGEKTLNGREPNEWTSDDIYEFELQRNDGGNWTTIGTRQSVNKDKKTFDFTDIIRAELYTAAGSYDYRVIEIEPTDGTAVKGVAYDKTVHAFEVIVTDTDMDGSLDVSDVIAFRENNLTIAGNATDGFEILAHFTNTYSATGNTNVAIEIHKSVTNNSGSSLATLDGFAFGLYRVSETTPAYVSQQTTGTGITRLIVSDITAVGTYSFVLKEIAPTTVPAGWSYDTTEIPVTVEVIDNGNGTKSAIVYLTANGNTGATNQLSVGFTNTYTPTTATLPIDFVSKTLRNKALNGNDFTFAVQSYDVTTETATTVLEGTNNINGKVTFNDTLKFDKVGTYFYNIIETSADKNGITTDKNIYRVVVTVSDTGGALSAKYDVLNVENDQIVFENTYTAAPVPHAISGTKALTGRPLREGEFTFTLTEAKNALGEIEDGAAVYTAQNDVTAGSTDKGTFTFDEITYTAAGTYYYVIAEEAGSTDNGIAYSTQSYVVAVNIADDLNGNLYVESQSHTDSQLVFNNSYNPSAVAVDIVGHKTLTGNRYIRENDFTFIIDSTTDGFSYSDTAKNNRDGIFTFDNIVFEKAGIYNFVIKEMSVDKLKGVTYDTSIYSVSIAVTDNQNGRLVAETPVISRTTDEGTHSAVIIAFYNSYLAEGTTLTLNGTKTLVGKDLADGEFTFELYASNEAFDDTELITTAKNQDGKFAFELEYTSENAGNTYYYVVKEQNAGNTVGNIKYDGTEYRITVVVEDDLNGSISAVATILKGEQAVERLDFENTFVEEKTEIEKEKVDTTPTSPKTGQSINLTELFALLFIGGGLFANAIRRLRKAK